MVNCDRLNFSAALPLFFACRISEVTGLQYSYSTPQICFNPAPPQLPMEHTMHAAIIGAQCYSDTLQLWSLKTATLQL